ncbi:MAG: hypothetical protein H6730_07005 [Deltaproteobacteria bacterium]|nr:hypothetical protein [Deltaproteobacteria bacterium]
MEAWEQLSDRIYEALAGGGVEARRALTRIAEEVSEHEAELSREQQAYWRLLALAHLPGVTAEEAGEVRALASTLREDVELAWLASFYAAMALFYAGLVDACAEVVDGMAEPPDAGEQFAWRALKISELQLACEIWLRPSDARPEAIAEFFERSRQMSDPASMTLPEELLMALPNLQFGPHHESSRLEEVAAVCVGLI